jgi:peptidoglycan/xylan/chitin deacetylase (PgdA/CDA1 family)
MMINKILVLTFHSIDNSGSIISVAPFRFRKLLHRLHQRGYQSISFPDVIEWLLGRRVYRSPRVMITFDDGFENLYSQAFPVLIELKYRATLFLTSGYCGKKNNWPGQHPSIPTLSMLTWDHLKEMDQTLFDVQAHTKTHPCLYKLSPEKIKTELMDSKTAIEKRLAKQVDYFAYPYGYFHTDEDTMVRQYFKGACTTHLDFLEPNMDRFLIPRIDMFYFSNKMTSRFFLSPLFVPYLRLRQSLRRLHNAKRREHERK